MANKEKNEDTPITEKVGEALSAVGDKVGEIVAPAAEKVGEVVTPVAEKVGEVVAPIADKVGDVVTTVTGGDKPAENEDLPTTIVTKGPAAVGKQLPEYQQRRRSEIGRVVSDKMQKTVVVSVERSKTHPIYKKVMRRTIKFMAHDELGSTTGDTVRIIEARPMSKRKRWQVVEILQKAEQI